MLRKVTFQILRLKLTSLREANVGEVVNLVTNDATKIEKVSLNLPTKAVVMTSTFLLLYQATELHFLWVAPTCFAITVGVSWQYVGATALAGGAYILLLLPFQCIR